MVILYTVLFCLMMVLFGYLIGSIPTSIIIGKMHGIDIRQFGSHNAGGTNVGRVIGKKAGILTIVLDILKCFRPCLAVFLLFNYVRPDFLSSYEHLVELFVALTATGVCLGHTFPLYAGFRGGKCVACFAGYIVFISPLCFVLACTLFFVLFFLFRKVSLSSVIAVPTALLLLFVPMVLDLTVLPEGFNGGVYFGPGCYIHLSYVTVIFAFLLASLVILRHLSNIKRLEKGEEPETHFKKD